MANKNGKIPEPQYDDNVGKRRGTTTRRYTPGMYDTQRIVTEDVYEEDETEEEGYDQPDTVIPRRSSAKLVAPLVLREVRQPARATRDTEAIQKVKTQQIRIEPAQQTKQPLITRRNLFISAIVGSAAVAGSAMAWSFASTKYSEMQHQMAEGKSPATSLALVCGHNNDSAYNPTQLHAYIAGDKILFVELPAGDPSKAHIYQTQSLHEVGYSGSLANVYIELIPSLVNDTHVVIMRATCEDVSLMARAFVVEWKLVSSKGYFHTEQPK